MERRAKPANMPAMKENQPTAAGMSYRSESMEPMTANLIFGGKIWQTVGRELCLKLEERAHQPSDVLYRFPAE